MTAQTPVYGIKYPVAGEPIRTTRQILEDNAKTTEAALVAGGIVPPGAPDLAALAGRVSTLENTQRTAPTAITLAAGFTVYGSGFQSPRVWTEGRTVFLQGMVRSTNSLAGASITTVATLSTAYRPAAAAGSALIPVHINGTVFAHWIITSAGLLQIANDSASATGAGNWLPLTGSYHLD